MTPERAILFMLILGGCAFWVLLVGSVVEGVLSWRARRPTPGRQPLDQCQWRDCPMAKSHPGHRRIHHGDWIPKPRERRV